MSDSVSLIVAVVILFLVFRWVLGSNATSASTGGNSRGGPTHPRRRNVTPDMVEAVKNMFPDIHTAAIQADLAITGSVEVTCNKIISQGGLPIPSHILPRDAVQPGDTATTTGANVTGPTTNHNDTTGATRRPTNSTTTSAEPSPRSLLQRYQLDAGGDTSDSSTASEEPAKVWSQDSSSRQQTLLQRKQFMVLEARRKFLEKQKRKEQGEPVTPTTSESSSSHPV